MDDLRQGQSRYENNNQDEGQDINQTMFLGNNNATINVNEDGQNSDGDKTPTEFRFSDGDQNIQNQIKNMVLGKGNRGTSKKIQNNYSQNNHDPLEESQEDSQGLKHNKTDFNNLNSGYDLETLIRDQDYRSIPNGFKNKLGAAFSLTEANCAMDAGLCGIYNMGNTCFLNTCKSQA